MENISFLKDGIAYTKIPTYGGTYLPATGVAKVMRTYLKRKLRDFTLFKVRVKKATENSIYVYVERAEDPNVTLERMKQVRELCGPFEAGKFNGMEDIYEPGNEKCLHL